MKHVIYLIQIILSILLVLIIMIQQKGTGLGSTFGGEISFYRTKRGAEKLLMLSTAVLIILFIIFSLLGLLL